MIAKLLALLPVGWLACASLAAEPWLKIDSGPGQAGELTWETLVLNYRLPALEQPGRWTMLVKGLSLDPVGALGRLEIVCEQGYLRPAVPTCRDGRLVWEDGPLERRLEGELSLLGIDDEGAELVVDLSFARLTANLSSDGSMAGASLELSGFDPALLSALLPPESGISQFGGALDGGVEWTDERITGNIRLRGGVFDSADGSHAGDGLSVGIDFQLEQIESGLSFVVTLSQFEGELLIGPAYLPPPAAPFRVHARGQWVENQALVLDLLEVSEQQAFELAGRVSIDLREDKALLESAEIERLDLSLANWWPRWADSLAAVAGFPGLTPEGRLGGRLRWKQGEFELVDIELVGLELVDPQQRIGIVGGRGQLVWIDDGPGIDLSWQAAELVGLPLGESSFRLRSQADILLLAAPVRVPMLDGSIDIERFAWRDWKGRSPDILLDARIRPLDLRQLTLLMGWPELGGTLAGSFPGLRFSDGQLSFDGGIDIEAFSGRITVSDLVIERLFGTLPALAAQIELERLDLLELTGAFNFGRMEGLLSGNLHGLRLLDWRPVAMNARLHTLDDSPRRRISQRAVDNLSSLGGAGGALLSGTLLRVFDDFPYRRAGLACHLRNNICHIDGVAPHESGGFYIVEGRGLPRLDVVGHRRLVDWPQLMRQLENITAQAVAD